MTDYRLYFLSPADHISRVVMLDCATDEVAVAAAHEQAEGCAVELWQRDRRVIQLAADRTAGVG